MGTADGMLTSMRSLLGLGEERPNFNRLTRWYAARPGLVYLVCPWCDIAVSWAAADSGNSQATMGDHAWTVEHARAFVAAGRWHSGLGGCRPGDVVFFDWGGTRDINKIDHVGVIEAVHSDGTVTTIEGNTDDRCMRRRRGPGVVAGYGRPAYEGAAPVRLQVDGQRGPLTVRALQRWLNRVDGAGLDVDGEFGPLTAKALQHHLGVATDGQVGPVTTKALQRMVGAAADGVWGPVTTRALQRFLNGQAG